MSNEDIIPTAYKYSWATDSDLPLQGFLTQFKPSMVQNDGTKPWIWVHGAEPSRLDTGAEKATVEAANFVKEVSEKVESVKNDDSIPLRSSKKTGAKSKKEVREQIQAEATEKLKEISLKHGFVSGKWLIFAPADKIDAIWSGIATSLVSGPLSLSTAFLAKVSTSSESDTQPHLICVYLSDVYDKPSVTEVMKILLRNHGVNLSGVKSNLYTCIGLDSKHASGIPSTVWKNAAILSEKEIKELKDAYFAELGSKTEPTASGSNPAGEEVSSQSGQGKAVAQPSTASKSKLKLKKKGQEEDPFASDNDDDEKAGIPASKAKTAGASTKRIRKSDDDQEAGEGTKKKKMVK